MIYLIFCIIAFLVSVQIRYNLFAPPAKGLPVLMYHKVSEAYVSGTSVTAGQLERQFQYLVANHFNCIRMADLGDPDFKYPPKPLLLTFDDGYLNNYELLYPLLVKYRLHAAIMLPVKYLGLTSEWETEPPLPLLDFRHLSLMDPATVEFGLHSYGHTNYRSLTTVEVEADLSACFRTLEQHNIPFVPVLAYPYGAYPREQPQQDLFFGVLKKCGIRVGLRIGNRYNRLPILHPFEVKRIDIKGTDTFWEFKTKLKKGRIRLF